jgi:hypothetical protein
MTTRLLHRIQTKLKLHIIIDKTRKYFFKYKIIFEQKKIS